MFFKGKSGVLVKGVPPYVGRKGAVLEDLDDDLFQS